MSCIYQKAATNYLWTRKTPKNLFPFGSYEKCFLFYAYPSINLNTIWYTIESKQTPERSTKMCVHYTQWNHSKFFYSSTRAIEFLEWRKPNNKKTIHFHRIYIQLISLQNPTWKAFKYFHWIRFEIFTNININMTFIQFMSFEIHFIRICVYLTKK